MADLIAELWGFLRRQRGNGTTPETYNIPVTIESGGSGSGPTGTPADGGATQAGAYSNDQNLVYNGATWDLERSANAAANTPGVGLLGAGAMVWDGTNWRRVQAVPAGPTPVYGAATWQVGSGGGLINVLPAVSTASGARNSGDGVCGGKGAIVVLDVTALTGAPSIPNFFCRIKDSLGNYANLVTFSGLNITTTGAKTFIIYPGVVQGDGNYTASKLQALPAGATVQWLVSITQSGGSTMTFALDVNYID